MSADRMHRCPAGRCPREITDDYLMCPAHWRLVPLAIQRAVYAAYDGPSSVGTPALLAAQVAAVRAVNRLLGHAADPALS